jgi:hypothetical protein
MFHILYLRINCDWSNPEFGTLGLPVPNDQYQNTKAYLTGIKGMKGIGKISAECKVQCAEKETVQRRAIVALSNRLRSFPDTPILRYTHTPIPTLSVPCIPFIPVKFCPCRIYRNCFSSGSWILHSGFCLSTYHTRSPTSARRLLPAVCT